MNYYNEWDARIAEWLRELIKRGLIPMGEVDERSIKDVQPADLKGYTQCHFFAGIGGWPLALQLAGWDVDRPVWTGSCPCQPFSCAGKGKGFEDERHLWPEFARLIGECKPSTVFGEQVASKAGREWLAGVFADLEGMGYAAAGADLCAAGVGAPHIRQRLWWVADSTSIRSQGCRGEEQRECDKRVDTRRDGSWCNGTPLRLSDTQCGAAERHRHEMGNQASCMQGEARERQWFRDDVGDVFAIDGLLHTTGRGFPQGNTEIASEQYDKANPWGDRSAVNCADGKTRRLAPSITPVAHGIPARVVRLRGYGNAIVPQVAAEFIQAYEECLI